MTTAAQLDDINLDMDLEDELKHVMSLEEEISDIDDKIEKAEQEVEAAKQEVEAAKQEDVQGSDQSTGQPVEKQAEEKPAELSDQERLLMELREERARLQQQLNDLSVSALADRRRLESIEKTILAPKEQPKQEEPVDEGPTPEQIIAVLDQKIAETDAALSKAEVEDPASAPALRQQLRQLERYYNNYVTNVMLSQIRVPDPNDLVQQAIKESATQNQFQAVRQNILREFPILDAQSEYFNEQLRDQVHEIYNPMINAGNDPVESLIKATMLVVRANGIKSISELQREYEAAQAAEQNAAKAAKNASGSEKVEAEKKLAAAQRKVEQVEKNLKAAEATPPNIANVGSGSESHGILDKYDFSKMSIKEFSRLSDAELEQIESALMMYND